MEKEIEITTPAGRMDCFIAAPDDGRAHPAVILLMDIWGLRAEFCDVARRIAAAGYYCIAPNTYYRQGRVRFDYRNEQGQMRSIESLPADVQEGVRAQMWKLTDAMVVEDAAAIVEFLRGMAVTPGAMGTVGYCMGGRHALAIAGHFPELFRATASLHGTRLVTDEPHSVHKLAHRFRGEIYCGFAERDALAPPSTIAGLAAALAPLDTVAYHHVVHAGTDHGYSLPDRDIYDAIAAERDWQHIFAMFKRQLSPAATQAQRDRRRLANEGAPS